MESKIQINDNPISIIKGRINPSIYAFRTNTVPNYVKIGDTTRTVQERMDEWKQYFPNLDQFYDSIAKTENGKYFRDFAVHDYLEIYSPNKHERLTPDILKKIETQKGAYYSREFFKDVATGDIEEALKDINASAQEDVQNKYQFYSEDKLKEDEGTWPRTLTCEPRELQQKALLNFNKAYKNKRNHLLMYAVMRFGKSITSLQCAKAMKAKVVLVVSAKVDVRSEWKYTTEAFKDFKGYKFLTEKDLRLKGTIQKYLSGTEHSPADQSEKYHSVVIFLSLQDLSGKKNGAIKEKFEDLYNKHIDLLIVDETHFGARGATYGKEIKQTEKGAYDTSLDELDNQWEKAHNELKLDVNVQLHLSGTPYRILMGSEFEENDIIIKCQYSDIVDAKEKWDSEHSYKDPDETNDIAGDNPYFGFPQMIRFAFTPNESARNWIKEEERLGHSCSLDRLFEPTQDVLLEDKQYHFIHENEVLDLLKAIDGCQKDANILDILDLKQIKDGHLCHHMVMVLPLRASCDAMAHLITTHKNEFKNLGEYELINIAGKTKGKEMSKANYTEIVKEKIKTAEKENRKTIVLTVGRMLTGVTVPEWDTMLFMKEASSPQEYDQAIYRLQSPYVLKRPNENGGYTKFDMKPQTLLVDFDVNRMFYLQEQKSLIYNLNESERGGDKLKERITRELDISPVLMMNIADGKLKRAEAQDVIDAIRNYSANLSIQDEAVNLSDMFDVALISNDIIKNIANKYKEIDAKDGFSTPAHKSEDGGDDAPNAKHSPDTRDPIEDESQESQNKKEDRTEEERLKKKIANFISRIYFFALLTKSEVKCLKDIITAINANAENRRIAKNVDLSQEDVKNIFALLRHNTQSAADFLNEIDKQILNIRDILEDVTITDPVERVTKALRKFGRLSEAEIITPNWLAEKMVALIPSNSVSDSTKFLDIASKEGEFACAIYKKFGEKVKNNIYSIPTSKLTYEFTLKVYKLLGMPLKNVIANFNSYDLINSENKEQYIQTLTNMEINVILGNPPYQETISKSEGNKGLGKQLFPHFMTLSYNLRPQYATLITPSRWFKGDAQDKSFLRLREHLIEEEHLRSIHHFPDYTDVFSNDVMIKGGVSYFLHQKGYSGNVDFYTSKHRTVTKQTRPLFEEGLDIVLGDSREYQLIQKVRKVNFQTLMSITTGRNAFGIIGKEDVISSISKPNKFKGSILLRCKNNEIRWTDEKYVVKNKEIAQNYKVFISKAAGDPAKDDKILTMPYLGNKNEVCTDSFIPIGSFRTKEEATNLLTYLKTKFVRYMVSILKVSQNVTQIVYRFVPLQDFTSASDIDWSKSVENIDKQLYKKYKLSKDEIAFIESKIKPM